MMGVPANQMASPAVIDPNAPPPPNIGGQPVDPNAPMAPPIPPPGATPTGPYDQWAGMPPPPQFGGGGSGGSIASPVDPTAPGGFSNRGPSQADYGSVQGYSDQAHDAARRYLDPQQEMQNKRHEQTLVNKGVDPFSEQGQMMLDQLNRQQADANNSAAFGALQFGQGIQNQMFGQSDANNKNALAARGQDVQRYGAELGHNAQLYGHDTQRYGADLNYNLGMGNLDMNRQQQDFMQMMGLEGVDFRNRQYGDQQQQYQDQLTMALMGMNPVPGVNPVDPYSPYNTGVGGANQNPGLFGRLFG